LLQEPLFSEYAVPVFNSFLSAACATEAFDSHPQRERIAQSLNNLFMTYGVHEKYRLSLLHKHFDLEEGEKLVHVSRVAVPWSQEQEEDLKDSGLGYIVPIAWAVRENSFYPYEFVHSTQAAPQLESDAAFFRSLALLLAEADLLNTFGVLRAGDDESSLVEITEGRANILIPGGDALADHPDRYIVSAWQFSPEGMTAAGRCRIFCGIIKICRHRQ
jgi:hypothetical protein